MATCSNCGNDVREGDWTCGFCGTPVATGAGGSQSGGGPSGDGGPSGGSAAAGGIDTSGYAPGFSPDVAPAGAAAGDSASSSGGLSKNVVLALIIAGVAIVAIIAVWFLVLRSPVGSTPFSGTWIQPGAGNGSVEISGSKDNVKVKMSGKDAQGQQKTYTIPAHMEGSDLVITLNDFMKATDNKEQAAQAKAAFEAIIKDFKIVFTVQDAKHLKMAVEGTMANGTAITGSNANSVVLVKQ